MHLSALGAALAGHRSVQTSSGLLRSAQASIPLLIPLRVRAPEHQPSPPNKRAAVPGLPAALPRRPLDGRRRQVPRAGCLQGPLPGAAGAGLVQVAVVSELVGGMHEGCEACPVAATSSRTRPPSHSHPSLLPLSSRLASPPRYVASTIIGATSLEQLKENIEAFKLDLDEETLAAVDAIHMVRRAAALCAACCRFVRPQALFVRLPSLTVATHSLFSHDCRRSATPTPPTELRLPLAHRRTRAHLAAAHAVEHCLVPCTPFNLHITSALSPLGLLGCGS